MSHIIFRLGDLQKNVDATVTDLQSSNVIQRLWNKDPSIWRTEDVHEKSILTRLGWIHSAELMQREIDGLLAFAKEVAVEGFTHAVVLGMGGSSLCSDVCRATFGSRRGFPQLLVLDSTNPASVRRVEKAIKPATSLFIVASKSGGTTETNMFYKYFYEKVREEKHGEAGRNFVAITDPGTQMEEVARQKAFRRIFRNPTDIGGRYSALSYFGLVPMALIGMDIHRITGNAVRMAARSSSAGINNNPGAMVGVALAEAFKGGKDKLTIVASPRITTFAYWLEQLIAESTGKEGKGIIPVEGEPLGRNISADRFFLFLTLKKGGGRLLAFQKRLRGAGHPYIEIGLDDIYDLGGEFFRWEFATSVAAAVMHINPFDEPNVKESKDNTVRMIEEFKQTGSLPRTSAVAQASGLSIFCEPSYADKLAKNSRVSSVKAILREHLRNHEAGDYVALLAYVDQNEKNLKRLQEIRTAIGSLTKGATTLGFGPRYLHSTGQLHKGGKQNGIFILITADERTDCEIPGEEFSFEILKNAQALGDYQSLAGRLLPIVRVHLGKDVRKGLARLRSVLGA